MRLDDLTYGEKMWLESRIADGLRTLGYTITPALDEAVFKHLRTFEFRALGAADDDYAPPDPYESHLAKLREATMTPEQHFEAAYKADRLREFEAEKNTPPMPKPWPPLPPVDTTYQPPDPYAALKKESR